VTFAPTARRPDRDADGVPTKALRDEAVEKYHAIEGGGRLEQPGCVLTEMRAEGS